MADKWHALCVEDVTRILETNTERGLTSAEVVSRHERFGFNELKERPPVSFWTRLLDQLKGFVIVILIVASVVSAALGDFIEAAVIMAIVVLNAAIGVFQESKAEAALAALKKMAAPEAQVIRDGHRTTVPTRELVPGDVVLLDAGNAVPADVRLVETANLKVDEASLTGESVPVNKRAEKILAEDAGLGDRSNSAYMSTMINYGRGKAIVVKTGMNTEIGLIAEMIQSFEEEATPLQKKLNQLGRTLGIACLAICALVFLIGIARFAMETGSLEFNRAMIDKTLELFMIAVALAIAAVPEGLPAIVTVCLALGMQEMVRRHALIRRLPAVETLGSATVICSDKTGTLTQNQMTVTRLWADGRDYQVSGRGYDPVGECMLEGNECKVISLLDHSVLQSTLRAGRLCNDADLEIEEKDGLRSCRMVGDPTEGALVVAAAKVGFWRNELEKIYPRVAEIPFDSDRKRMTTIHNLKEASKEGSDAVSSAGSAYAAVIKGAPDLVLNCCTQIETIDGPVPLTVEKKKEILDANARMASQALRVLAMAYRPLDTVSEEPTAEEIEKECIFLGLQGMIDPARTEVAPAVALARKAGIRTVMVTGDYAATAAAVASEIGILRPKGRVISGAEIEAMDDEALRKIIHEVDVCARVTPNHKMRIVEALKARGEIVSMTGDGVNDAPALKRANIGVSMGITGTDVTKQTADMVLTDDNYVSIVSAIEQGRIIYSNIRKFVYFLISCNLAEICIIFLATLFGWPSPLTAIQLLWLNLLTDGAPALALGMEKGDPDIMDRPPRPPQEPVINHEMIIGTAVQAVAITSAVLIAYWRGMNWEAGQGVGAGVATAETMAFVTLSLSELLRAYTSRSERYPLLKLGIFTNKYMQYAVGLSILLILPVVYIPVLQPIFGTVPLTVAEWMLILPLVLIPSVANEVQKYIMNSIDRRKGNAITAAA